MEENESQPGQQPASDQPPADQRQSGTQDQPPPGYQPWQPAGAPLYRPASGRMIAGVAAGIAQYLDVDVTLIRIALAVLTVVGGAGIPVYLAGWLLIPDQVSGQSIAGDLIGSVASRAS